jgi:hypothetical protein
MEVGPEIAKTGSLDTPLAFLLVMWEGSMVFNVS